MRKSSIYDRLGGYGMISHEELVTMGNNRVIARCPNRQSKLTVKGPIGLFNRLHRNNA